MSQAVRKLIQNGKWVLTIAVLVLLFQNCSSNVRDSAISTVTLSQSSGSNVTADPNPAATPDPSKTGPGVIEADYSVYENETLKANLFTLYDKKDDYSRYEMTVAPQHGSLVILDHRVGRFTYVPTSDFIGIDGFSYNETLPTGEVHVRDTKIYVVNSSMLADLQPALAVRAPGCIGCHSTIGSNLITDYGSGGDGVTDYSFGKIALGKQLSTQPTFGIVNFNSGNVYFDHGNLPGYRGDANFSTVSMASGTQIIIPKGLKFPADLATASVNVPADAPAGQYSSGAGFFPFGDVVKKYLGLAATAPLDYSLKSYLQSMKPALGSQTFAPLSVAELTKIYIGAPTQTRLGDIRTQAKPLAAQSTADYLYVKESAASPDISGISIVNGVLVAVDGFTCDGDLFVTKKLIIKDMTLNTNLGCRIYSSEIVYVQGRVRYPANRIYANMQISSARAIWAGLGKYDKVNGTCGAADTTLASFADSMVRRTQEWWVPSMITRGDPAASGGKTGAEIAQMQLYTDSKDLDLLDARCIEQSLRTAGKIGASDDIGFTHMLWNAPKIENRFRGDISGVIISEIAILAVSRVKYNFDPVFTQIPVLPMLSPKDFLLIVQ